MPDFKHGTRYYVRSIPFLFFLIFLFFCGVDVFWSLGGQSGVEAGPGKHDYIIVSSSRNRYFFLLILVIAPTFIYRLGETDDFVVLQHRLMFCCKRFMLIRWPAQSGSVPSVGWWASKSGRAPAPTCTKSYRTASSASQTGGSKKLDGRLSPIAT